MTDSNSRHSSHNSFRLWAKENFTPKDFVKKYPLPQVARIHEGGSGSSKDIPQSPTHVDLQQPFLLFKTYSSVKVHARSLQADSRGVPREVGPTVAIPEDYTGWFAIVTDNGRTQTAKHYTTVEQVATAHVPFFLVRNDTPAYKLHDLRTSGGKLVYAKTTVKTGHVLKLLGVFEDIHSRHQQKPSTKYSNLNGNTFKYAQCLNYKGEVVFLPFVAKGMFYPTGTKATRSTDHVYLMSHLLKFVKFPLTVRLVCGFLPKVPCNFTGLLRLTCAKREEIILACTLLKERNVMLEMDMTSGFTLSKALDEERYAKTETYRSAVAFCADEAEIWRRQMKVMHFVFPETTKAGGHQPLQQRPRLSRKSSSSSSPPFADRELSKMETQSVCISMIFDDLDEDDSRSAVDGKSPGRPPPPSSPFQSPHGPRVTTVPLVGDKDNKRKTKFWTLRRLKKLMRSHGEEDSGSQYGIVRTRRTINDLVNDGSENANDEFTTRLPKDIGRSYVKLPGFEIPEDGTYVTSPTQLHPIYDAIS